MYPWLGGTVNIISRYKISQGIPHEVRLSESALNSVVQRAAADFNSIQTWASAKTPKGKSLIPARSCVAGRYRSGLETTDARPASPPRPPPQPTYLLQTRTCKNASSTDSKNKHTIGVTESRRASYGTVRERGAADEHATRTSRGVRRSETVFLKCRAIVFRFGVGGR